MAAALPASSRADLDAVRRDYSTLLAPSGVDAETMQFAVEGIRCASCMSRIERAFASEPGVLSARVNLTAGRLSVSWPKGGADPTRAIALLDKLGFPAHPFLPEKAADAEAAEQKRLLRALGVAGFAVMNIMLLSVSVWSGHSTGLSPETRDFFHWISALIALPTAAYSGRPFFESAIGALKARAVNMDVPISLGILLALGLSVVETMNHGEHAYFDGAVMLIFFLLLGRVLDQMMRRKTRDVAANLAALRAPTACRILPGGALTEVPAGAIEPGDLILVRPGDRIGVDGEVVSGESEIDRSLVTGETALALVRAGDAVHAGSINHGGALEVRALRGAGGTVLDEIERLLAAASETRSGYVRLADKAARLYAPMVHSAALLTFLGWMFLGLGWQQALVIAITVLIITCPCALGLAIPAVQVAAAGALFKRSILLNSGEALERLAAVDTVVFDKTGTLTEPEPRILNVADVSLADLAAAGRLAQSSRHPLARAVARASGEGSPFADVRETSGAGVEVRVDGVEMRLGSPAFCGAEAEAAALAKVWPDASVIAFRRGEHAAVFAVAQALRPDAASTIAGLQAAGLDVHIVSGDRSGPVGRIGDQVQVSSIVAGAKPADKVAYLEELARDGHIVMMVGDGVNDAAALAKAHVSMSPVSAAELTQANADAVFMEQSLLPVAAALRIARRAHRVMVENLWLAVVYNMIAVPVAILGYATPLVAALAMSGSSLLVTLNALRARQDREP
jgi:Cu2+-exporting ATPase